MFVEHLTRYKVLSTALWIYRSKVDFMCYVLKGSVEYKEGAQGLLVRKISYWFLMLLSDTFFSVYLLLMGVA